MLCALAEQEAIPAFSDAAQHIFDDETVAQIVLHDLIVTLTDSGRPAAFVKLKARPCKARDHDMREEALFRLLLRVNMIANATNVHMEDRMVTVLPFRRCSGSVQ